MAEKFDSASVLAFLESCAAVIPGGAMLVDVAKHLAAGAERVSVIRALLQLFGQVSELEANLDKLLPQVRAQVNELRSGGTPSLADFVLPPSPAAGRFAAMLTAAQDCAEILEGDGKPMHCAPALPFQNWGRTVANTPASTYIPRTVTGIQNLVKWAAAKGKRVRAAGYRHTWGDLFSDTGDVLISLFPLNVVEDLPSPEPPIDPGDELQGIRIVGQVVENGTTKALCRVGGATTNEQFRRWCLDSNGGNWSWTLPLNVIMVEVTFGGSNAPICHGAGLRNQTLSDLVAAIEFVNPRGELQKVDDPGQLRAAAGCFGLLGIVTAVTLKLDDMTFAAMRPFKQRVGLAVPPPSGYPVPAQVDMSGITPAQLAQAAADFYQRCADSYYAEWFWFPYQAECWINTWNNDGLRQDAQDYPPPLEVFLQWLEEYLAECLNNWWVFQALPGWVQAMFFGWTAMSQLPSVGPSDPAITTPLIDGLHFRRGIQNLRVLDMEMEIPIPGLAADPAKPDWSICQRAWWDAISVFYGRADAPMRIALEMRIMGGSGVTMAPQFGNSLGTCSIEVLTNLNTPAQDWLSFMQQIADKWTSYRDAQGNALNVRPHWAKQWQGLKFAGQPAEQYLPGVAYKNRLSEFTEALEQIAAAGGYTLGDLQKRFSNPLFDTLFAPVFQTAALGAVR